MKSILKWLALKFLTSKELRDLALLSPNKRIYKTRKQALASPETIQSLQWKKESIQLSDFLKDMKP